MTREEAILLSAYTGFMFAPDFGELQKFCEETLGRPVLTNEFADKQLFKDLRVKLQPKLKDLIQNIDKPQIPTREQVEKVWRAHWNESVHLGGFVYCSRCGYNALEANNYTFCPKCGSPFTDEAVDMVMGKINNMEETKK